MTESTRAHTRVSERTVPGERIPILGGTLLFPPRRVQRGPILVIHFHGAPWLAEESVRLRWPQALCMTFQLGSGSGVYSQPFAAPDAFANLMEQVADRVQSAPGAVVLTSFSAGYGAIREILRVPQHESRIGGVLLMDSMHASYEGAGSAVAGVDVEPFVAFARRSVARKKHLVVTHSEVFPGTYASTTETADYLLRSLGIRRRAVLAWGPVGMQQLSEAHSGNFSLMGFAGNSAPDHVDHFYGMASWLKRIPFR